MTDQDPLHTDCGFEVATSSGNADALRAAETAGEVTIPEIVRDVQADDKRDLHRWLAHCVNELGGAVFIKNGGHLPLAISRTDRGVVLRVES